MISLPIDAALPALRQALANRDEAVLEAPPGAGKTTRVPLALLHEPWLAGQTILMLEPRRLAARAAAERLASELGEQVGETVGYRIRLDSKVGLKTRIEVVTEGILTRRLQADPALEGVGLLIFDEFHVLSLSPKKPAFLSKCRAFLSLHWSSIQDISLGPPSSFPFLQQARCDPRSHRRYVPRSQPQPTCLRRPDLPPSEHPHRPASSAPPPAIAFLSIS
ncbi:DEAD-like helicase [Pseudomonas putida GB-1]|uniref:DEAD-like helicase n=1 Tax=Pseudomonas putida (strain GB-1) TaxID=76869 RepID=B0KJU7_PSEPG|nr:DEAD-like helicase [Pseudomonas putida GB-1]